MTALHLPGCTVSMAQIFVDPISAYGNVPVHPVDGRFYCPAYMPPYNDEKVRQQGISKIIVDRLAEAENPAAQNVLEYTPSGYLLPTTDPGTSSISALAWTQDGQPVAFKLHNDFIISGPDVGGGTILTEYSYHFNYEDGRLIEFEFRDTSDLSEQKPSYKASGQRTRLEYDATGNRIVMTEQSLDSVGRSKDMLRKWYYQYDSQARIFRILEWDHEPENPEPIMNLPRNIAFVLLQKASYWQDTVADWIDGQHRELNREEILARMAKKR